MESFRVLELVIGSNDPERVGLAKRKMTRMLTPQVNLPRGTFAAYDKLFKLANLELPICFSVYNVSPMVDLINAH